MQTAPRFEQLGSGIFLSGLIFRPRFPPIPHGIILFVLVWRRLLPTTIRDETRENKDRLDTEFFKDAKVRLDTRRERERQSTSGSKKGFPRRGSFSELSQVVGCIDTQT